MTNANALIGNSKNENSRYCFAKPGELYLVYLPNGGTCDLDLSEEQDGFTVSWFNPRTGGPLATAGKISGGKMEKLEAPAANDWLAVVAKEK